MPQEAPIRMILYRVRLMLEEGQHDDALSELLSLQPVDEQQQRDISYYLGWCYIQQKQWSEAVEALTPLLKQTQSDTADAFESSLERERIVLFLLNLGIAAVNLSHYEDAAQHFTLCLKILHDRRVHLPAVRIKARYSLAMTCLMRGLYTAAIQHYDEALRLCKHYAREEEVPHIYHGLCSAYRYTGDFVKACVAAEYALELYHDRRERSMEARMHNVLGRIHYLLGDFHKAADRYMESLAIANNYNGATLVMGNCADLADLRRAEGRFEEARRYCDLAIETMERSDDVYMSGRALLAIGKVAREEARLAENQERRIVLLQEAAKWFERASSKLESTQAYPDRAEVYGCWAQTLEDLGLEEKAINLWRSGYEFLALKAPALDL
jgi:tetratricopeptide (TPR) repeat protein